jgi:hypothetical protein
MAFKPLTKSKPITAEDGNIAVKTKEQEEFDKLMASTKLPDIIKTTEERIKIIFDDSGSMETYVEGSHEPGVALTKNSTNYHIYANPSIYDQDKRRIDLAIEGTIDYLKNCKPRVTAVEITPLNVTEIPLTKNLPRVAADLKQIDPTGGTPLYEFMARMVDSHKEKSYTRVLIFTDGEASSSYNRPNLIQEMMDMKIPIDFIIIGNKLETQLSPDESKLKAMCEKTGGTFLICKDAKSFKNKMKFFAPMLRHQLAAIASDDSYGE